MSCTGNPSESTTGLTRPDLRSTALSTAESASALDGRALDPVWNFGTARVFLEDFRRFGPALGRVSLHSPVASVRAPGRGWSVARRSDMSTSNPLRAWVTRRTSDGTVQPATAALPAGASTGGLSSRHWLPARGPLATINTEHGDAALGLWLICEVRFEAHQDAWKVRFNIYVHKHPEAEVPAAHSFLAAVEAVVGSPVKVAAWREWRSVFSRSESGVSAEAGYALADEMVEKFSGLRPPALLRAADSAPVEAAVPVPAARTVPAAPAADPSAAAPPASATAASSQPETMPKQVFIASKIAGYANAAVVRRSLRKNLRDLGFDGYVAERDPLGGFAQSDIDRKLETSEHVVAILWDTLGAATAAEIELAARTAGLYGFPRLHVFVSAQDEHVVAREQEQSRHTLDFLDELDRGRRYVRFFSSDRDLIEQVLDLFTDLAL